MAQDGNPVAPALRLFGQEITTDRRLHSQDVEVIEGYLVARELLRFSHVGEVEGLAGVSGEILENPVLLTIVQKVRNG
jgi:hypothetical protein